MSVFQGDLFDLVEVDDSTLEVLKYVALKEDTSLIRHISILHEDCQDGWAHYKERKTLAMHRGTHFGHWKAGHLDNNIAEVHTSLVNIRCISGYSPERWCHGVNTLIPKGAGNFRVKRLQTIPLYEAYFNFNNKILGLKMMRHAEQKSILAQE